MIRGIVEILAGLALAGWAVASCAATWRHPSPASRKVSR